MKTQRDMNWIHEIIEEVNNIEKEFNWKQGHDNRGDKPLIKSAKIFQAIDAVVSKITGCELHSDYEKIGEGQDYSVFELSSDHVIKIAKAWNYHLDCPSRFRGVNHPLFLKHTATSDQKLVVIQPKGQPIELTKEEASEINNLVKKDAISANFPVEEMDINSDGFVQYNGELRLIDC